MKKLLFCLIVVCLAIAQTKAQCEWYSIILQPYSIQWFIHKYQYNDELSSLSNYDECQRFKIFQQRMEKIRQLNQQNQHKDDYQYYRNQFTHLTDNETNYYVTPPINPDINHYKNMNSNNSNRSKRSSEFNPQFVGDAPANLPSAFSWQNTIFLTPVQNQGYCGCCYAFATADAIASAYAIKNNVPAIELSQEQIIDCTFTPGFDYEGYYYSNNGCQGGNPVVSMLYVAQNGIATKANYPFSTASKKGQFQPNGFSSSCHYFSGESFTKITQPVNVDVSNVQNIMSAITQQPVTAFMYADSNFMQSAGKGIYYGCQPCYESFNHAVLIVGYGTEKGVPHWIIKNSWGPNWGDNGYFRLPIGQNSCCIETMISYPQI